MLVLVLAELDIVLLLLPLLVLAAAELDEELSAARTAGAAVRKAWPPNVVVPPTVPVARVIAEPPTDETITTGAEFASAGKGGTISMLDVNGQGWREGSTPHLR